MAEPFKNMFREETVRELAERVAGAGPFDIEAFMAEAMDGLEELELKDRARKISTALRDHLEPDITEALAHIVRALPPPLASAEGVGAGFVMWPFCQLVEDYGLDEPEASLATLYELTRRFSAELAIRPFLVRYPERTLELLREWVQDEDLHVRRLVSEGCRPRLPWGLRLNHLIEDPSPILPLLETLRDDPEEYVRRSVANNLNDISKDHPDLVVDICRRWLVDPPETRERLVRHALRTLIKGGHPGALELLGFGPPQVEIVSLTAPGSVAIGESALLELTLRSTAAQEQSLVIDYALHFPGARGRTNRKVFKWCTATLAPGEELSVRHRHSFSPVTTRRTLPGPHRFELQVNGLSLGEHRLDLSEG